MEGERAADAPRSVAELGGDPAWQVTAGATGQWITAEVTVTHPERTWRIGLTPGPDGVTALILWADGAVVDHARGAEPAMVARAHHWRVNLAARRPWHEAARPG
ncbi:hypothetical protein [Amycolatopsis alkalitolerans]|uniref:Uncharacterized protein n=1 Tax=Amycolatopsis alkalitolerans TaxID=2547244 RepID=A0A5C4LXP3_9PSEU|nr:hypothetical protein [Amycolatopsis alkalitolerans]TNC23601.1 hypothetical protein FG385_21500 [Amycolatopsis alkalitolerans]